MRAGDADKSIPIAASPTDTFFIDPIPHLRTMTGDTVTSIPKFAIGTYTLEKIVVPHLLLIAPIDTFLPVPSIPRITGDAGLPVVVRARRTGGHALVFVEYVVTLALAAGTSHEEEVAVAEVVHLRRGREGKLVVG